jgi:pimeloyl-ACP methyl ester carboxylesterase
MSWARWVRRAAIAAVLLVALFVFGWVPFFLGGLATARRFAYNDQENQGLTPKSFDLAYEDVSFRSPDGVELKGWWVPADGSRGTVILIHGLNRSRIEMVKKTSFLSRLGWNALLFDQRHHGESGGGARTFGFYEKEDAKAAIAFARARAAGPVVLWGVSLGAVTAALAAAEDPSVMGLVADSSFRSLRDTVAHHLGLFRSFRWWLRIVPTWPVADEVVFWMGRRGGFDPDALDVLKAVEKLRSRPSLFVCNSEDRRMPKEIAFELQAAAGPLAKVLVVPGNSHGGAYREATAAYEHAVATLLQEVESGGEAKLADSTLTGGRS